MFSITTIAANQKRISYQYPLLYAHLVKRRLSSRQHHHHKREASSPFPFNFTHELLTEAHKIAINFARCRLLCRLIAGAGLAGRATFPARRKDCYEIFGLVLVHRPSKDAV